MDTPLRCGLSSEDSACRGPAHGPAARCQGRRRPQPERPLAASSSAAGCADLRIRCSRHTSRTSDQPFRQSCNTPFDLCAVLCCAKRCIDVALHRGKCSNILTLPYRLAIPAHCATSKTLLIIPGRYSPAIPFVRVRHC